MDRELCPDVKLVMRVSETSVKISSCAMAHRRCVPPRSITSADIPSPSRANSGSPLQRQAQLFNRDILEETAFSQGFRYYHVDLPAAVHLCSAQPAGEHFDIAR